MSDLMLALVVALVARTVTQEDIFRELRVWAKAKTEGKGLFLRKLVYPLGCEYCFSHYVAGVVVALTGYNVFGWRWIDYVLSWLFLTALAVILLAVYDHLKIKTRVQRLTVTISEEEFAQRKEVYEAQKKELANARKVVDALNAAHLSRSSGGFSVKGTN